MWIPDPRAIQLRKNLLFSKFVFLIYKVLTSRYKLKLFFFLFCISKTLKKFVFQSSVVDSYPDPQWIRIQWLCGSVSRYHTGTGTYWAKMLDPDRNWSQSGSQPCKKLINNQLSWCIFRLSATQIPDTSTRSLPVRPFKSSGTNQSTIWNRYTALRTEPQFGIWTGYFIL
jgi:hypothetical protein